MRYKRPTNGSFWFAVRERKNTASVHVRERDYDHGTPRWRKKKRKRGKKRKKKRKVGKRAQQPRTQISFLPFLFFFSEAKGTARSGGARPPCFRRFPFFFPLLWALRARCVGKKKRATKRTPSASLPQGEEKKRKQKTLD